MSSSSKVAHSIQSQQVRGLCNRKLDGPDARATFNRIPPTPHDSKQDSAQGQGADGLRWHVRIAMERESIELQRLRNSGVHVSVTAYALRP
jgi:hypothetical protein